MFSLALLDLPARVRAAEALLPAQAAAFLAGSVSAEVFRGHRVPQGLYEQRAANSYMLRVRLPGGLVTVDQLAGLADLAGQHCERLHLTTRQALQFHGLALGAAVTIQQGLAALGLSARGTGGNTVRNVTADPLGGVARDEAFDVRPWALVTTNALLDRDGSDALPRKFKVVFSGSDADRAGAAVADLGFIARLRDGQPGFTVTVGGGLGGAPALALPLLDWVPAHDAPLIAEAIVDLFAAHGNRTNKARARLRHVRHRLGETDFLALCEEWIAKRRADSDCAPAGSPVRLPGTATTPGGALPLGLIGTPGLLEERVAGRFSVRLAPALGDLSATTLQHAVAVARRHADPVLRVGLDQELWLTGVAGDAVPALLQELAGHGLGEPGARQVLIPACAGADTCKLGLLRSRACATAIAARLERDGLGIDGLRISGCPNACGRHLVGTTGLEGKVKRVNGRLLPCFEVFHGGRHGAQGAALGTRLGAVPAKCIPDLIAAAAQGGELRTLVAQYGALPATIPEDWFTDWGDTKPFSLAGLGEGECAAG